MKCPVYGITCQGTDCSQFYKCDHVMADGKSQLGDNFPHLPPVVGVSDNGNALVQYTEQLEIELSKDVNSKYYKGPKITQSEVDDFIIDLNRETSNSIMKKLKEKSSWKSTQNRK